MATEAILRPTVDVGKYIPRWQRRVNVFGALIHGVTVV